MEPDTRTAAGPATHECDVCVVGAGPAGLALAHDLERAGRSVVLLESGDRPADPLAGPLTRGGTSGDPYAELHEVRVRGLGGCAGIWNTIVGDTAFGKYVPLDPVDFDARACAPWSGWPFPAPELAPHYRRARMLAGIADPDGVMPGPGDTDAPPFDLDGSGLANTLYQLGPASRFTRTLPDALGASGASPIISGATLTELVWNPSRDRITAARWRSRRSGSGIVRAGRFVLAAGGLENPRLLLLAGLTHDWLGRGFMEHPVDHSLVLVSRHAVLVREPTFFSVRELGPGLIVSGRIGLERELLEREGLLNASLRLTSPEAPALLRQSGLRWVARRLVPFRALRRTIGGGVRRVAAMAGTGGSAFPLRLDLEQAPHRDNRVTLSEQVDEFGQRRPMLHWRWRAEDQANLERMRLTVTRCLEGAGAGRVEVLRDGRVDPVAFHHAGTTRMHVDPALGVVDPDLRVHGVENLYVAGSSVFPTAGVANPTLTILALSARLAGHLAGQA